MHFLNDEGKFRTFLLGLLQIKGRHSSENLADRVSKIIHKYRLEDRISYFVTDNAENNNTCLEDLGAKFGFDKQHRRLRQAAQAASLLWTYYQPRRPVYSL